MVWGLIRSVSTRKGLGQNAFNLACFLKSVAILAHIRIDRIGNP